MKNYDHVKFIIMSVVRTRGDAFNKNTTISTTSAITASVVDYEHDTEKIPAITIYTSDETPSNVRELLIEDYRRYRKIIDSKNNTHELKVGDML